MMQVIPGSEKPIPEEGDTWEHRKGAYYTVLGLTSEPDAEKAEKHPRTVFYQGPDGRKWTRTLASWYESFNFVCKAIKLAGELKKGDMREMNGQIWHCTDPDIDRWVSNRTHAPCPICQGIEGCDHTLLEREKAAVDLASRTITLTLGPAHARFLAMVKASPGYKFNGGEAYDEDGNPLWPRLEVLGLIRSVGSYKWVPTALTDEEVHATRVGRIPGQAV